MEFSVIAQQYRAQWAREAKEATMTESQLIAERLGLKPRQGEDQQVPKDAEEASLSSGKKPIDETLQTTLKPEDLEATEASPQQAVTSVGGEYTEGFEEEEAAKTDMQTTINPVDVEATEASPQQAVTSEDSDAAAPANVHAPEDLDAAAPANVPAAPSTDANPVEPGAPANVPAASSTDANPDEPGAAAVELVASSDSGPPPPPPPPAAEPELD